LDNWELSVLDTSYDIAADRLIADGFLILTVLPLVQKRLSGVFGAAQHFFPEPNEAKEQTRFPKDMGYRPFGGEYSNSPLNPDQVESFTVSPGAIAPNRITSETGRLLCQGMLSCYESFESIAEGLTIHLANKLSQAEAGNTLRGEFHRWSRLQLNYSRPKEVKTPFINESHEDGALLTVAHAREPGLELQISDETFVPITNSPNEVLVIPGDIAWLLSGGRLRPMFHRVRPESNCAERIALLFFADINPRLCEPWVRNEINRDVDIGALVLKNPKRFGLDEWKLE
jgi:isopenicillin N synthase-like dioxygenase